MSAANEHGASQWTYDDRNLVRSATSAAGRAITYGYDSLRRRTSMTDPSGGLFTYQFDGADRLIGITNPRNQIVTLQYDAAGRKTRVAHGTGAETSYVYDCADRVRNVRQYRAAGVVDNILTYTYSGAGDRTKLEELDGSVSQWTYDRARQLTSEQRTGAVAFHVTYSYDPVGNRTLENDAAALTTFVFDAANQLSSAESVSGVTTYAHDADGNRTQLAAPAWQVDYTWDEQNRLTRADTPSQTVSMQYDALSRRVAKENAAGTHEFTFDGKKILEEHDGAGGVAHEYTTTLDEYGDLLSDYDGAANTAYQFDALGSTAALLDESASVTDRYVYRAFGEIASHTGASDTPFTFVGRQSYQHDSELDLYFASSRHLDPVVGRWVSQDPIRWQAGDGNLYRYVRNNPATVVDPSGEQEQQGIIDTLQQQITDLIGGEGANYAELLGMFRESIPKIAKALGEVQSIASTGQGDVLPAVSLLYRLLFPFKGGTTGTYHIGSIVDGMIDELLGNVPSNYRDLLKAAIKGLLLNDFDAFQERLRWLIGDVTNKLLDNVVDRDWSLFDLILGDAGKRVGGELRERVRRGLVDLIRATIEEGLAPRDGQQATQRVSSALKFLASDLFEGIIEANDQLYTKDKELIRDIVKVLSGQAAQRSDLPTLLKELSQSDAIMRSAPKLAALLKDAAATQGLVEAAGELSASLNDEKATAIAVVGASLDVAIKVTELIETSDAVRNELGLKKSALTGLHEDLTIIRDAVNEYGALQRLDPGNQNELEKALTDVGDILARMEGRVDAWGAALGLPDGNIQAIKAALGNARKAAQNRQQNPLGALGLLSFIIVVSMVGSGDDDELNRRYSGKLIKVNNPDPKADLLATRIGGISRVRFENDPSGREFDVVSDKYIAQTNEGKQVINERWRNEAKATFEAAKATGRVPYFHFERQPGPDLLRRIDDYTRRYGITPVIDIGSF